MENYINSQHRYYTLDYYLKKRFDKKVFKVALNGNFTCPNRDGTISNRGCIFCSPEGSGEFGGRRGDPLDKQFREVKNIISLKWPDAKYIAYFQANTNTYGPIEKLRKLFYEAINLDKDIVCLSVATRPDCLDSEVIDLLSEINKIKPVWVELGLQTINEETAHLINRGYTLDVFCDAVNRLRKAGIEVIVHIINGLPYEEKDDMLNNIKYLNTLDIQGIKIHSLFILKGTDLETLYYEKGFKVLTLEEYVDIIVSQIALLRSDIIIHRINGDAPKDQLIEPKWSLKKLVIMNEIDKRMRDASLYQGIYYKNDQLKNITTAKMTNHL